MSATNLTKLQLNIVVDARKADKAYFDQLVQFIQKGKNDIAVSLLLVEPINDKRLEEQIIKGKLLVSQYSATNSVNQQFADLAKNANAENTVVCYNTNQPISAIAIWANNHKKQNTEDAFLVASQNISTKGSKNKIPFGAKIYSSLTRLFSPVKLRDSASGILMGKTSFLVQALNQNLGAANNYSQTLYNASASGNTLIEVAFSSEKRSTTSVLSALVNAVSLRFGYYFKQSLLDRKTTNLSMGDGNHPIYRMAFFVGVLLAFVAMPIISQDYGSTWDEKAHNDYAQLSYNYFSSFGSDTAALAEPTGNSDWVRQAYRFYGEQLNTISAFLYNWFDTGVYETRHFVNSIYALIGLIFIALIALELSNWRGGLIALLFIFFNPGWLGFGSNNPTDIPFATGFAFAGYYMIKVLRNLPAPKFSHIFWLAFGIGLGIASRVGAFLLIAYLGLFMGINWLSKLQQKQKDVTKLILPYLKIFLLVAIISYIFGIITWPYGISNPFSNPFLAFKKSSENAFYTNNVELFEGVRMFMINDAPWYYVIKFIGMGNPIYLLLGFALSIVLLPFLKKKVGIGYLAMLLFMAIFPVAYAEYSNINYYNGWRHYLFILPALVPLAAISYEFLLSQKKAIAIGSAIILGVLFIKPTFWMVKNHPHQYVYFNELAGGLKGAYGTYETDYYSNSCREAGEWIANQHPNESLTIGINNEITTASYWAQKINPKLNFIWVREYEEQKPFWDYLIVTSRTYSKNELLNGSFPPANTVYTVEVDGVPLAAVVKRKDYNMPLGYKALDAQNFDSALVYFSNATKLYPKDEEAFRMLGFTYLNKANMDSSEYFNRKAIAIYPQNFSAYSNLGIIYFNRKEFKTCIAYFDTATKLKENLTESWYYSALAYLNLGDYNNGIKNMKMSITHNGQYPEAYYYLAKAYAATGNLNKASEAYQSALSLNGNMVAAWAELANVFTQLNQPQQANYCMEKYRALGGN